MDHLDVRITCGKYLRIFTHEGISKMCMHNSALETEDKILMQDPKCPYQLEHAVIEKIDKEDTEKVENTIEYKSEF